MFKMSNNLIRITINTSKINYSRCGTNCNGLYLTDWLGLHIRNTRRLQDLYVQCPAYDCQIVTPLPEGLKKNKYHQYVAVLKYKNE